MVSKISAAAKLRTVLLYQELKSYKKVAEALQAEDGVIITPGAVASRLRGLYIFSKNHDPKLFADIAARLEREVKAEKAAGIQLPERSSEADPLTRAEKIETLEVFIELGTYGATAKRLGLDFNTTKDRLIGILGEKKAHPIEARRVLKLFKTNQ